MAIEFNRSINTFFLDGKGVTYAIEINKAGYPVHLYFGASIPHESLKHTRGGGRQSRAAVYNDGEGARCAFEMYSPEYAFYGTGDFREPAVVVENSTGDRLCSLLYESYEILPVKPAIGGMPSTRGGETLVLNLRDADRGIRARLYYTVFDDCSVIARHAEIINEGQSDCYLRRAYSFSMGLHGNDYNVTTLFGGWAAERSVETVPMHHGVVSIDSKRCSSSDSLNPFMALTRPTTSEELGEAYGVSLVYSSSFALKVEGTVVGDTLITGGINDFNFSWKLCAGERFETPEALIAYSCEGLGGMSRAFHDVYRNHLIPEKWVNASRPAVINHWETTEFASCEEIFRDMVAAAEDTGIDTFVIDDGWFRVRDDETCSLGDWRVNEKKFKNGLRSFIDYVHSRGMKFGIWVEPEMVSEDSELFRAHPDYAIGSHSPRRCYTRSQLVLDITRREVRDYIVDTINRIIRENGVDYVKWDCNRHVTDIYSFGREADRQAEFAHRYALGLYELCERIVKANPDVFFEGCSSGGARFDGGMLYYFPQIWTSDNTDADARTKIQYGTSMVYPLSAMSCHVSDVPCQQTGRITPMRTRGEIARLGAFGYELDTRAFTEEDKKTVAKQIQEHRRTEDLIMRGDLYRLEDPFVGNYFSEMIVSKDKSRALVCAYRRHAAMNPEIKRIRLSGLDSAKTYRIPELELSLSGAVLMNAGIVLRFELEDFTTRVFNLIEEI